MTFIKFNVEATDVLTVINILNTSYSYLVAVIYTKIYKQDSY